MAANTEQEVAALIENNHQPQYLEIGIPEEDFELAPDCCIYKVPSRFREANQKAFTPRLISIGPIHHGNKNLARMERQKERYYDKFCQRTSENTLEQFASFIKARVRDICRCYDVEFVLDTELAVSKFVKIILFDAVFLIELFLRNSEKEVIDFLVNKVWLRVELELDLLLLENQLPFFILEALYNLAFATSGKPSFPHLACLFLNENEDHLINKKGIKHFIDLTRSVLVRTCPSNSIECIDNIYSATMLHEAGVKFEAIKDNVDVSDLYVKFAKGVLKIPYFYWNDHSEIWIRNLIAFEQCHYSGEAYFCSYMQLLDYLVDTDKDVDLLEKEGIFVNDMGSNAAVANMINNLMTGVVNLSVCYDKIGKDLNEYYDNPWNRTRTTLKHVYFNNLWRGTATFAAFIVVVITLTQTVLAILDRAMPTK
ncbi:PREDICTED: UPF0481 protein At3g47200 [Theobroma cacao]|uniref:UPF0481 protein At3g47200 n=1 Tax=Theobroma cacao TaxID=3641 RepID=A0AB32VW87_THECC|nr:PREDICTED: UPF0481 protein At3g47200 [Theobroma cacao]